MAPFINLGLFSVRTFTALIGGAVLIGVIALVGTIRRSPSSAARRERAMLHGLDAALLGVLGGVTGARLLHVLLNLAYFNDHFAEAFSLRAGGLSWHGAVYGGLLGIWLACRWRKHPLQPVTDVLALVLPPGMMAAWAGCWASACAYGAEVWTLADHPAWAVSERADIFGVVLPRYNVQLFGVWLGAGLLALAALLTLTGWLRGYRLGLILALAGAGMFGLGYFRGDGAAFLPWPDLTWDQVLDLSLIVFSILALVTYWRTPDRAHRSTHR